MGRVREGLPQQQRALEAIRLREQVSVSVDLQRRQSLGEQAQPFLHLAGVPYGLGEQDQTARSRQLLPRGQDGRQALTELLQACCALSLHSQRPALTAGPQPHEDRKPLCNRQGQEGFGLHLDRRGFPALVMQIGYPELGQGQTKGMGKPLGQGQGFPTPPHGLRWIA